MNDYGLWILSAHGSYYTYTSGFLFKQTRTEPVILLTEESDFYKDLYYGIDLLTHRVIKINGLYCITPSFFQADVYKRQPQSSSNRSLPILLTCVF